MDLTLHRDCPLTVRSLVTANNTARETIQLDNFAQNLLQSLISSCSISVCKTAGISSSLWVECDTGIGDVGRMRGVRRTRTGHVGNRTGYIGMDMLRWA